MGGISLCSKIPCFRPGEPFADNGYRSKKKFIITADGVTR